MTIDGSVKTKFDPIVLHNPSLTSILYIPTPKFEKILLDEKVSPPSIEYERGLPL